MVASSNQCISINFTERSSVLAVGHHSSVHVLGWHINCKCACVQRFVTLFSKNQHKQAFSMQKSKRCICWMHVASWLTKFNSERNDSIGWQIAWTKPINGYILHNHSYISSSGMAVTICTATYIIVWMVVWNVAVYVAILVRAFCQLVISSSFLFMWASILYIYNSTSNNIHACLTLN